MTTTPISQLEHLNQKIFENTKKLNEMNEGFQRHDEKTTLAFSIGWDQALRFMAEHHGVNLDELSYLKP